MERIRAIVALLVLATPITAGEFNKKLSIGDAAPAWKDLPGTDGKTHSLADLKDKDVVVVVFTCNSCPIAAAYEDRLIDFAKKHAKPEGKVALVAINVNTTPDDRLEAMKKRAQMKGFPFSYLYDESQRIAIEYGAKYTPEFFVLGKDRKVVYMGAMDDKTNAAEAKVNYLDKAIDAALNGEKPATGETLPRGCMIRYVKTRDDR